MELVKKYIRCGLFIEARRLIEKESNVNDDPSGSSNCSLPTLIMLVLCRDEVESIGLCQLLLEKGYRLSSCDSNGLCALNYAIALRKLKMIRLFLSSFNFDLNLHRDR